MGKSISVRLDDEALKALAQLEARGVNRSEAVRTSLMESAARQRMKRELSDEVAALEKDKQDLAEMRQVAALMEDLRAPR